MWLLRPAVTGTTNRIPIIFQVTNVLIYFTQCPTFIFRNKCNRIIFQFSWMSQQIKGLIYNTHLSNKRSYDGMWTRLWVTPQRTNQKQSSVNIMDPHTSFRAQTTLCCFFVVRGDAADIHVENGQNRWHDDGTIQGWTGEQMSANLPAAP